MFERLASDELLSELRPALDRLARKQEQFIAKPMAVEFRASLDHKLIIELTHGSTAIEGNTLTLRETQLLIDEGIAPTAPRKLREIYESVNHHKALTWLHEFVGSRDAFGPEMLCKLHRFILANIDDERCGQFRHSPVMVVGAPLQPMRADKVPTAVDELTAWINAAKDHPVVIALEAHYRFVKIHPFFDGNGRTARLLMNGILLRQNYPHTVIAADDRSRYLHALDDADRGKPFDYCSLIVECVERSLDQYLIEHE